jgi:hypothetical protein
MRKLFRPEATLGLITALVTGTIFLFRGRNYKLALCGDDRLLFDHAVGGGKYKHVSCGDEGLLLHHAVQHQSPLGRFHFIDPFGLLDLFNGYVFVIPRIATKVLAIGGSEHYTLRVFWIMSLAWTLIAIWVALLIGKFARPYLGFLAALTIAIMPFSNLVMMAQVNTIYIPAALAVIIAIATRQYPQSRVLQVIICVLFSLITLSTVMSIVPLGYLIWLVYIRTETVQPIERRLVWFMGGSLILQILSYQSRGHDISISRFIHEILLASYAFAPQFVRNKIFEPKTVVENILLYGIPILLGAIVFILTRLGNQSELRAQVQIAQHLFLIALLLLCMLIVGNGWLNSHYLFIPTGLFWIGALLASDAARHSAFRFRMFPIFVVLTIYLIQLSGTYFVI